MEGFIALCYYSADQDTFSVNTLDVTREDFFTPRGIRVGATRDQVLEATPRSSPATTGASIQTSRICSPIFLPAIMTPVR